MGKKCIIAETGAGQHGVATATVCARFGLECIIYMGTGYGKAGSQCFQNASSWCWGISFVIVVIDVIIC